MCFVLEEVSEPQIDGSWEEWHGELSLVVCPIIIIECLLFAAIPNLSGPSVVQQNTDDPEYVGVCVLVLS